MMEAMPPTAMAGMDAEMMANMPPEAMAGMDAANDAGNATRGNGRYGAYAYGDDAATSDGQAWMRQ